jgi:lysophospholipase L1-like esterase
MSTGEIEKSEIARAPARPKRRWRTRVLALVVSTFLALLLAEVAVRALVGTPLAERLPILRVRANPHRGWEMMPSEEHYTYQHRVHVNALGLRGSEIGAKAQGERRVLCLGDSLIYGQGVADDETLPAQLEALLEADAASGASWSAVNGGLRAYGTSQELGLLEELGPRIEPDFVVLFWFWNDIVERPIPETCARYEASGPVAFDTNEVMQGWAVWKWRALQLARRSALVMYTWDQVRLRRASFYSRDVIDSGLSHLETALPRFRALCEKIAARPIVAVIPDHGTLEGPHPSSAISARAIELARAAGLAVIDLSPALEALSTSKTEELTIPFDGHYTAAANRAMATRVAETLREME